MIFIKLFLFLCYYYLFCMWYDQVIVMIRHYTTLDTTLKLAIYEYLLRNTIKCNAYTLKVLAYITYPLTSHIRNWT